MGRVKVDPSVRRRREWGTSIEEGWVELGVDKRRLVVRRIGTKEGSTRSVDKKMSVDLGMCRRGGTYKYEPRKETTKKSLDEGYVG